MAHSMNDRPCSACGDLDGCHLPGRLANNRLSLEQFWELQADWSQKTFGTDAERGPIGPLKHLKRECDEALAAPRCLTEYADLLILTLDATRRAGFTLDQLKAEACRKLKANMARKWPVGSPNEPVEHIREG